MRFGRVLQVFYILFFAINLQSSAQSFFSRSYGGIFPDFGSAIQTTADGGYIVAGRSASFSTAFSDVWVLKLDSSGTIQWQKTYSDSSDNKVASSIKATSDGGYIVAGFNNAFTAAGSDVWVFKLDSLGSIVWQKSYGGNSNDFANSIDTTSDGGYIVAGQTESFGGVVEAWVLKLDSSGNVQWQKTYGGPDGDNFRTIQATSDGGFIASGFTFSFGSDDAWIVKLNSSGNVEWQKHYGDAGSYGAWFLRIDSDGGYIAVGSTSQSNFDGSDIWISKLDSSGNIQWQKIYGGNLADRALSVQPTSDGGYAVAGFTYSFGAGNADAWILKIDSSGNVQWQKTFGGNNEDWANSIQQTIGGGFLITGHTYSFANFDAGLWVLSIDANGQIDQSCTLSTDTSIIPVNGGASAANSAASILDSNANVSTTNAVVTPTNAQVDEQCPAPSCVYCDEFDDSVPPSDWTYMKPSWTETNGNLVGSPQGRKAEAIASPAFNGCSVCTVETLMMSAGGEFGKVWLMAWYQNKNNTIELLMREKSDTWVVKQKVGGTIVAKGKGSDGTIDPNVFYNVQLSFDGTSLILRVNSQLLLMMPLAVAPNGTVGFRVKNTVGSFDYINVN